MTETKLVTVTERVGSLPGAADTLPSADFFEFEAMLSDREQRKLAEVRQFLAAEVTPYATDWWNREHFPAELLPKLGALGLSTPVQQGYSHLFAGLVIAEMTRADTSIATFFLVHHDLFVESLHRFGTQEQRDRLLDDAMNLRITGAFALTEPDHGSDVAGGMATTATRHGDTWILNGAKRWIGNGTFCDYMLVWARDTETAEVRGFIVDTRLNGFSATKIEHKTALRTVQNADVVLSDVHVPEADRFAGINSFRDTNHLLRGSRIMVGWQTVGQQLAAFDTARRYAVERQQFGRPLAGFQLIQSQLVHMLGNTVASMAMMARVAQLQEAGDDDGAPSAASATSGSTAAASASPVSPASVTSATSVTSPASATMAQAALAKSYTSARMRESVALGRSILGGNGIVTDYAMAKIFADAEAVYTYEGSFEINTLIVGRDITGISAII